MSVDIDKVEQIIEDENDWLQSVCEGIAEGIWAGIREGIADGLKRGVRDGLKECLAEGLGNVSPVDIKDVVDGIGENATKTAIREGSKNIFKKSAETYIRRICEKIINEVQKQNVELTRGQIYFIINLVMEMEQEAARRITDSLSGNPFAMEFAAGIQKALEESLESEFKLCEEQLKDKVAGSS